MKQRAEVSWIKWFCSLHGNDCLCEVDLAFIVEKNLRGLSEQVDDFKRTLAIVRGAKPKDSDQMSQSNEVHKNASKLYFLIHQRFILTPEGLRIMRDMYREQLFGICPRVYCRRQPVVPYGVSNEAGVDFVKIYCPRCQDLYRPSQKGKYTHSEASALDGAAFGKVFAQRFFTDFKDDHSTANLVHYVPKVYGFRLYNSEASLSSQNGKRGETRKATSSRSPSVRWIIGQNAPNSTVGYEQALSAAMDSKKRRAQGSTAEKSSDGSLKSKSKPKRKDSATVTGQSQNAGKKRRTEVSSK